MSSNNDPEMAPDDGPQLTDSKKIGKAKQVGIKQKKVRNPYYK